MNFIKKYKLRHINYNLISKINCTGIKYLPKNLIEVQLRISNKYINSQYNLILLLFILKIMSNQKPVILKGKKDQLQQGLRKNDCLNGYVFLRNYNLTSFYLKFVNEYLSIIDFNRINLSEVATNVLNISMNNINKIDSVLLKESKFNNTSFKLNIILKQYYNKFNKYSITNNVNILLSHFKLPLK